MDIEILPPLESLVEKFKESSQNLPKVGLRLLQITPTAKDHMIFILVDGSNDKVIKNPIIKLIIHCDYIKLTFSEPEIYGALGVYEEFAKSNFENLEKYYEMIESFMLNYDIILEGWHEVSQFSTNGKYFYEGVGRNFLKSCGVSTWAESTIDITINKDIRDLMNKWQRVNKKFIEYCFI
jgi:hypothetical protein